MDCSTATSRMLRRNRVVSKTCSSINYSKTLNFVTIASAILEATSQTRANLILCSKKFRFYLNHDSPIYVWRLYGELIVPVWIQHHHIDSLLRMMLWGYISVALRPTNLPFIWVLRNYILATYLHDCMLPVLLGPFLIQRMFICSRSLSVRRLNLPLHCPKLSFIQTRHFL